MSNALSMDLRVRFKRLIDAGQCAASAGKTLLLSRATSVRWGKKVRSAEPLDLLPFGARKGTGKLEPFLGFFIELIEQDNDITLEELKASLFVAHGMQVSTSGIDGHLKRHPIHIKRDLIATEQQKAKVQKAHDDWCRRQEVMKKHPDRILFLDETGTNTKMVREYGRGLRGQRVKGSAPLNRGGNQTLIAGLSCEGIVAPWVISGAMNGYSFDTYIEKI